MKIALFLPDFRRFVKNERFNSESFVHPTMYFETDLEVWFYKPVDSVLYYVHLVKEGLPEDVNVKMLKQEFNAMEIPFKISTTIRIALNGESSTL